MVELAFEQHRFWDVRRWKEGGFINIGRMEITKNADGSFRYNRINKPLVWDDKDVFLSDSGFGNAQESEFESESGMVSLINEKDKSYEIEY